MPRERARHNPCRTFFTARMCRCWCAIRDAGRWFTNPTILLSECRADTVGPSESTVCLPVPTLGAQAGQPCWKTEGAQLAAATALKHLSSDWPLPRRGSGRPSFLSLGASFQSVGVLIVCVGL